MNGGDIKIYVVMLHMADGEMPRKVCYTGQGDGLSLQRETVNCWYLESPPHGLPERYRKTDEYKLLNNKHAVYIFGRDSTRLVTEWNTAISVS